MLRKKLNQLYMDMVRVSKTEPTDWFALNIKIRNFDNMAFEAYLYDEITRAEYDDYRKIVFELHSYTRRLEVEEFTRLYDSGAL